MNNKIKLNTKKFIRNIIICLIAWIAVSLILNYAPGFKRDKYEGITNLIINDEDITENLKRKCLHRRRRWSLFVKR